MQDSTPRTLSAAQAAAELGVAPSTVYEAVRRGTLPAIKVGRRVLVPRDALERLLAGRPARELAPAAAGAAR